MVSTSTLVAVSIDALAFGFVLALLGTTVTLVFGLGELLNLAIGMFAVIAVILTTVMVDHGVGLVGASVASLVGVAAFGFVVDRTLLSLVYRSEGEERILVGIFTTLGLIVFLKGALGNFFPSSYTLPIDVGNIAIGDTVLIGNSVLIIVLSTLTLGVLLILLQVTYFGKATRTLFQDEVGARLVGIEPRRVRTLIFVLSVVVAGLAGLLFAATSSVSLSSGFELTVLALIVSIVGGVRSIRGTITAGVLLGFVNQYANFFIGSYVATIILYITAIAVLHVREEVTSI